MRTERPASNEHSCIEQVLCYVVVVHNERFPLVVFGQGKIVSFLLYSRMHVVFVIVIRICSQKESSVIQAPVRTIKIRSLPQLKYLPVFEPHCKINPKYSYQQGKSKCLDYTVDLKLKSFGPQRISLKRLLSVEGG